MELRSEYLRLHEEYQVVSGLSSIIIQYLLNELSSIT